MEPDQTFLRESGEAESTLLRRFLSPKYIGKTIAPDPAQVSGGARFRLPSPDDQAHEQHLDERIAGIDGEYGMPRASKAYSVAQVVKTKPSQRAAAMVAPRVAVCGPVAWMTHERTMARIAVITRATT